MQRHITTLRVLLLLVAAGAMYVFCLNAGFRIDPALVRLRAASQIVILLSFVFLAFQAPKLLPAQRGLIEKALMVVVGFFIVAHSLPLIVRIWRGRMHELVVASHLSSVALVIHHLFNMVVIPGLLWLALSSVVCRAADPKRKVNEGSYWFVILLALAGLAYISLTPTWTIV
ncbi:MAG TPA: hypothetical protein PKV72_04210 [Candidatus Peribacteria bacterium]|nr:hypothetical protein [Candidatus Peribacteria bacterium]